ncbi:MAG: LysR family transcriptional regulator [Flavobacteriaceae bacterium]
MFLAVARHAGSLAAARHLQVNQSTVQRRLVELETRLGVRLIERSPSGYKLTSAGVAVFADAERRKGGCRKRHPHPEEGRNGPSRRMGHSLP